MHIMFNLCIKVGNRRSVILTYYVPLSLSFLRHFNFQVLTVPSVFCDSLKRVPSSSCVLVMCTVGRRVLLSDWSWLLAIKRSPMLPVLSWCHVERGRSRRRRTSGRPRWRGWRRRWAILYYVCCGTLNPVTKCVTIALLIQYCVWKLPTKVPRVKGG